MSVCRKCLTDIVPLNGRQWGTWTWRPFTRLMENGLRKCLIIRKYERKHAPCSGFPLSSTSPILSPPQLYHLECTVGNIQPEVISKSQVSYSALPLVGCNLNLKLVKVSFPTQSWYRESPNLYVTCILHYLLFPF